MYAQLKTKHFEGSAEEKDVIDERLEGVVNRMFQWCLLDKEYKQAVGIALETRRMDILKRAIVESVRDDTVFVVQSFLCGLE